MNNNNQKMFKLAAILMSLVMVLIAVAFAYGKYTEKVNQLEATRVQTQQNTKDIVELKTDVKYIKEAVDRIEKKIE